MKKVKTGYFADLLSYIHRHYLLYLMLVLPIAYYIVFHYLPMYGLTIAFKEYNIFRGVWGSEWIGFEVFREIFGLKEFFRSIKNTLLLNVINLIFGFPLPVLLALLFNELRNGLFKRGIQTIIYLPHFMSWVIIGGMMYQVFSSTTGIINTVIKAFSGAPVPFLTDGAWWVFVYFVVSIWHDIGWSAIIYMSAITSIDAEIYEAARVDGCSRIRMMSSITLPNILGTIVIMLILRIGGMASIGFEQPLMLGNASVRDVSDVISTYVYRIGLQNSRFNVATAVGLFQSVINFALVISANAFSKKMTGEAVW